MTTPRVHEIASSYHERRTRHDDEQAAAAGRRAGDIAAAAPPLDHVGADGVCLRHGQLPCTICRGPAAPPADPRCLGIDGQRRKLLQYESPDAEGYY